MNYLNFIEDGKGDFLSLLLFTINLFNNIYKHEITCLVMKKRRVEFIILSNNEKCLIAYE